MPNGGKGEVTLLPARAAVLVVLAAGVLAGCGDDDQPAASAQDFETPAPREFVFLDDVRVSSYLGEKIGGLLSVQKLQRTANVGAEVSAGLKDVVTVGGSAEKSEATEDLVTPTASSRFASLMSSLQDDRQLCTWHMDKAACSNGQRLQEGGIVEIQRTRLHLSSLVSDRKKTLYVRPYPQPRRPGGRTRRSQSRSLVRAPFRSPSRGYRQALSVYHRAVRARFGSNPRLPFFLPARHTSEGYRDFRFYMPLPYKALPTEATLLSGPVTVVGKLIHRGKFVDREVAGTFAAAVTRLPDLLKRRLGLTSRRKRTREVRATASLDRSGLVIVPLAIYH